MTRPLPDAVVADRDAQARLRADLTDILHEAGPVAARTREALDGALEHADTAAIIAVIGQEIVAPLAERDPEIVAQITRALKAYDAA